MNLGQKAGQVLRILGNSRRPLPLLLDLLRLKRADYRTECRGLNMTLRARRHEWYAVFENIIREDYLREGIAIRPGDTILDIGGGFGSFALLAARKAGPTGRVVAYEPDPTARARIVDHARRNGLANVRTHGAAICGVAGSVALFLQDWPHRNTVFPRVDRRPMRTQVAIRVPAVSIGSAVAAVGRPIDLLKIHCEGCEYDIVATLDAPTARSIRQIAVETHHIAGRNPTEIVERLTALGFRTRHAPPMIFALRQDEARGRVGQGRHEAGGRPGDHPGDHDALRHVPADRRDPPGRADASGRGPDAPLQGDPIRGSSAERA